MLLHSLYNYMLSELRILSVRNAFSIEDLVHRLNERLPGALKSRVKEYFLSFFFILTFGHNVSIVITSSVKRELHLKKNVVLYFLHLNTPPHHRKLNYGQRHVDYDPPSFSFSSPITVDPLQVLRRP